MNLLHFRDFLRLVSLRLGCEFKTSPVLGSFPSRIEYFSSEEIVTQQIKHHVLRGTGHTSSHKGIAGYG